MIWCVGPQHIPREAFEHGYQDRKKGKEKFIGEYQTVSKYIIIRITEFIKSD